MIVTGLVQGVFFRAFAKETADRLNIAGWVRNLADGSVEIVAEGKESVLDGFVSALKKGPPKSRVDKVRIDYADAKNEFSGFTVRG